MQSHHSIRPVVIRLASASINKCMDTLWSRQALVVVLKLKTGASLLATVVASHDELTRFWHQVEAGVQQDALL